MSVSRALACFTLVLVSVMTATAASAQSVRLTNALAPDDYLTDIALSADGRFVVYTVNKADSSQPGRVIHIDRQTGVETRIDRSTAGDYSSAYGAYNPSVSDDGRYVVYTSRTPNLVPDDTNGTTDVFLFDAVTSTTTRVSVRPGGVQTTHISPRAAISGNGRYIVFESNDDGIVAGDTNGCADIFVYDRIGGGTERVSLSTAGTQGSGQSMYPAISRDGNVVAFACTASNLVPGDTGNQDIMIRNRSAGTTTRVSVSSTGGQADSSSYYPHVSADGRYVVFISRAANLAAISVNGMHYQVFRHDNQTGATELVSVNNAGEPAQGECQTFTYLSEDGRYVVFPSDAANLGGTDTNAYYDLFLRDMTNGKTYPVSVRYDTGDNANCFYQGNAYSANGRYAAFMSTSRFVAPGDTDAHFDFFVRDMGAVLGITGVTISGVLPPSAENSGPATLTIMGNGFVTGAAVKLTRSGQTDVMGTSVSVAPDGKTVTATLDLTGKLRDLWSLVVTNADTTSANIGFTVLEKLTVTGATPATAPASGVNRLTIAGTGITSGAVAKLTKTGQADITGSTISVAANGTGLTADFNLAGAALGAWNVVVTNSDSRSKTLANGLNVVSSNMTITGVSPNQAKVGEKPAVTVQGSGFVSGATVKLTKTGQPDINGSSVSVASGGGSLTAAFDLTGVDPGGWTLVVTNPNADHANGSFAIQSVVTVTGVTPASAPNLGSAAVTITGTGFASGAVVKLKKSSEADITATGVTASSGGTSMTASFALGSATAGARDVVVENTDGGSGTLAGGFTVLQQIGVFSLSPSIGACGGKLTVTVNGHHFAAGAAVKMVGAGLPDVQGSNVEVAANGGSLTADFDFTSAPHGQREVVVTNPDGAVSPAYKWFALQMRLFKVAPREVAFDTTAFTLDFDGIGVVPGTTIKLTGENGGRIQSTSTSVPSTDHLTADFSSVTGDPMGIYLVGATGPDGQRVNTGLFVRMGYTVSEMKPRVASPGNTISASIVGTGFANGVSAKLTMTGQPDIPGTGVMVVSPTQITADFAIPASAPKGKWNLVLSSPGGRSAISYGALATGLGLESVSPAKGGAGGTVSVVLSGLGFDANSIVKLTRAGKPDVIGMPPVFVSMQGNDYDRLETTLDLWGVEKGVYNVAVTTGGGSTFTLPGGFEIVDQVRSVRTYVVAPPATRVNKRATVVVYVHNDSNVDALGCLFIRGIPKGVTWEIPGFADRPELVRVIDDGTEIRVAVTHQTVAAGSSKQFVVLLKSATEIEPDISVQWAGLTKGVNQ